MTNPYQPPPETLATETLPGPQDETSLVRQVAFAGFVILTSIAAWLTQGTPFLTVLAIVGCGIITIPFARAVDRRRLIWGFVLGMIFLTLGSAIIARLTHEPPRTYQTITAYGDATLAILAAAIPLGAIAGVVVALMMPAKN
ncbi:MAG: hypothetical protein WBD20_23790 [Pirellulaceae bacterium]